MAESSNEQNTDTIRPIINPRPDARISFPIGYGSNLSLELLEIARGRSNHNCSYLGSVRGRHREELIACAKSRAENVLQSTRT